MKVVTWVGTMVVAAAMGVSLAAWHPWLSASSPSEPMTWSRMIDEHPLLARQPAWTPPRFRLSLVQFSKGPPASFITATYVRGTGSGYNINLTLTESRHDVPFNAPGIHAVRYHGVLLKVAQWSLGTGKNAFTDTEAGFMQNGNSYFLVGRQVPLSSVERMVLTLYHRG